MPEHWSYENHPSVTSGKAHDGKPTADIGRCNATRMMKSATQAVIGIDQAVFIHVDVVDLDAVPVARPGAAHQSWRSRERGEAHDSTTGSTCSASAKSRFWHQSGGRR